MNREEFENLSKLKVTMPYYTKNIEPEYCAKDMPKEDFVCEWLKVNKSKIVKCIINDIETSSVEVTLKECYEQNYEKERELNVHLQNELNILKNTCSLQEGLIDELKSEINETRIDSLNIHNENKQLKTAIEKFELTLLRAEAENNDLIKHLDESKHICNNYKDMQNKCDDMENKIEYQELEILKLKAKLYDMLNAESVSE